jgi:lysophospholipase L1-like esterase
MPDVYLMYKTLSFLACCVLFVACGGGSTPTGPTKTPSLSRTRFLAFGDSMTSGEVTVPVGAISAFPATGILGPPNNRMVIVPSASYPTQLTSMLRGRYTTQAAAVAITNDGKPGEYAFQASPRMAESLAANRPEVVLLLHGVNDLPFQNSDLPAAALLDLTRLGRQAGAQVFLSTLMPIRLGGRNSPNPVLVDELNAKIKAIAASEGAVLVNLFEALSPEAATVIGSDGLHPTEVGYKRRADVFFAAIQAHLEVK